jgi:glycosyltransferase involved in cell wall biosynthesis
VDRALRVAFVHKTLVRAGAERVLLEQVRALAPVESVVDVWLTEPDADRSLEEEVRAAHPRVDRVGTAPGVLRLARTLRRGRYDVVVTSGTRVAWQALALLRRLGMRRPACLATLHGAYPKHVRSLRRYAARVVDTVVLTYDFRATAARDLGVPPSRLAVARPLFPDLLLGRDERSRAEARALRTEWGAGPDAVVLGYFGRVAQGKGVAHWLPMAERLVRSGRDVHVAVGGRVTGKGTVPGTRYAQELDAVVASLPALAGRYHRLEAPRPSAGLYGAFDVMVLLSKREGLLPLVLVEALSAGTPVLSTAVGGIPTCLEDGVDAAVVPKVPDDGEDWTPAVLSAFEARMRSLVDDAAERRRLGEAGAARVRELVAETDFAADFRAAVEASLLRREIRTDAF